MARHRFPAWRLLALAALSVGVLSGSARAQTPQDAPFGEFSIGLAAGGTSCYLLKDGGEVCRGSFAGEVPGSRGCGIPDGCEATYLGVVFSGARYFGDRFAVVGEVGVLSIVELAPTDTVFSPVIGPRVRLWRVFGQVLVGSQFHGVFPSGLVVQPGIGIDLGHLRLQADYPRFRPVPELSGLRVRIAAVVPF